jgi:hypothetical protein
MRHLFVFLITLFIIENNLAQNPDVMMRSYKADEYAINRLHRNTYTIEYIQRMLDLNAEWRAVLEKTHFTGLDKNDQIDYLILKNHIMKSDYYLEIKKQELESVLYTMPFMDSLHQFCKERRRALKPNPQKYSKIFERATDEIKKLMAPTSGLKKTDSWQSAELAALTLENLEKNLEEAYGFYYDYDPLFSWWISKPWSLLKASLEDYRKFLINHYIVQADRDDGSGIIGKPLGSASLQKELDFEFIGYTPQELIEEGWRQYKWCEQEMKKISTNLGFGSDWKKALEHVKNSYVAPGDWPEMVADMAVEAIDFLEDQNLLTIPATAKETWRMVMISAESQKFNPFFLGGEAIWISYPTSEMNHTEKMMSLRGNNPHFSRAVVHHELIPGHHLQQYMNQRHFTHRNAYGTAFWVEGWPLYWEFTLWDKGFPRNDMDKIGMLFWRMHRAARIVFSLEYHLGNMTSQECIDFLVGKVGHERVNAEAEVRRSFTGRYGPLYQLAYMIGGLQMYRLANECTEAGMTEKEFNDFVIRQNNIPIELLRSRMLNLDLTPDYKAKWRFLEDTKP